MATLFAYIRSSGLWGRKLIADVDPAVEGDEGESALQSPLRSIPLQMDEIVLMSEQRESQEGEENTATRNLQHSFEGAAVDV